MLTLQILYPESKEPIKTQIDSEMVSFNEWLQTLIDLDDGTIFFFTTETTDVFTEEPFDYGNYDFSGVKVLERYRGFTFTTRLSGGIGCRVYHPHGGGILNFTSNVIQARELVDKYLEDRANDY